MKKAKKVYCKVWKQGTGEPEGPGFPSFHGLWATALPEEQAERNVAEQAVTHYLDQQSADAEEGDVYLAKMDGSESTYPAEVHEVERIYHVYAAEEPLTVDPKS